MAAARSILIKCGSTEIDGHAFCLGLERFGALFPDCSIQVTFLIKGASLRSRNVQRQHRGISLDICSLGELVDMYHTHKAAIPHDKVYALLGMCSDDIGESGLAPNYEPWEDLMRRLVKFILSDHVAVFSTTNEEMVIIKSKACVIGKVEKVSSHDIPGIKQNVEVKIFLAGGDYEVSQWDIPISAKSIQSGDMICYLQGALKPTIVRFHEDIFEIIVIAVAPPISVATPGPGYRDLLLFWDWGYSKRAKDFYDSHVRIFKPRLAESVLGVRGLSYSFTYRVNVGLALWDSEQWNRAEEHLHQVIKNHHEECRENEELVSNLLIDIGWTESSIESKRDQTPLSLAAQNGHVALVKLLLDTGKVEVDAKVHGDRTPLSLAAENGHVAVVLLLLKTGKVKVDARDAYHRTPLWLAAENGHFAVVKLLLDTRKVEFDVKDRYSRTPLQRAAENGRIAVVKLLLNTGKVEVDAKDYSHQTPLWSAAEHGTLTWSSSCSTKATSKLMRRISIITKRLYGRQLRMGTSP
jgi:hypothetical protein